MDIEQEGDSVSTTVSKEASLISPEHDDQLDKTHNQEFGLEAQGATTDDANEEFEMSSVVSGASAATKKKRKRNGRRNKNRNSTMTENNHGLGSKVASNEALVVDEKPLVVTTYVCSSSELNSVRKMIEVNGNSLNASEPNSISVLPDPVIPTEEVIDTEEIQAEEEQAEPTTLDTSQDDPSLMTDEDEMSTTIVDTVRTQEKVTSKSSVKVIYKIGGAIFENPSFTGPPPSSVTGGQSEDNPIEDDTKSPPPENDDDTPVERYEQPTQPSLGELWMSTDTPVNDLDSNNNNSNNKVENEESQENQLVNTDDIVLNDNLMNNNYLQERDPPPATKTFEVDSHYNSQVDLLTTLPEVPTDVTFECLSEENLLNRRQFSSSQHRGLTAPNPSVENSAGIMNMNLVVPPPLLHPHSLARIALLKRENPELVSFAQNAVDDILSSAQTIASQGQMSKEVDSPPQQQQQQQDDNSSDQDTTITTLLSTTATENDSTRPQSAISGDRSIRSSKVGHTEVGGENWVIDQNVSDDPFTESELEEANEPRRPSSSIMKNLWNCFVKRRKS